MSANEIVLLAIFGLLVAAALVLFLPARRSRMQLGSSADDQPAGAIFHDDDRNWYGGLIYYNRDDPNPLVPKRYGFGWTVNFAHPLGKVFLVVSVALVLLPIVLAIFAPGLNASYGCHPSGCHLTP